MGLGHYEVITDMVKHSTKFHKLEVGGEADHGLVQLQWHGKHQEDGATHVILCLLENYSSTVPKLSMSS